MQPVRLLIGAAITFTALTAADFLPPAGERYSRVAVTASILPGGRVIQPLGALIETGPGTFGLAISPKGTVATTDIGPERFGITFINRVKDTWQTRHLWARTPFSKAAQIAEPDWKGVASGIAFETEKSIWVSEGESGRVRLLDASSGDHQKIVDLNQGEWRNSFTADLALDASRRLLFVLDQANHRMAIIDTRKGQVVASVRTGHVPFAIVLSPNGDSAYVVNAGDSTVAAIDIRNPLKPVVMEVVPTGPSPAGILAYGDSVFVSSSAGDSISVLSAPTLKITSEILLRVPGLDNLRGIIPSGMAFDPVTGWLLVAEAGINAVGVIDTHTNALIAHIPAGWYPTHLAMAGDRVYVANMRGRGTGPNIRRPLLDLGEAPSLHHGTVTTFIMPSASELPKLTGLVYAAGGLAPVLQAPAGISPDIQHVILIVKAGRTFDEVLGDIPRQPDRRVIAAPQLARLGMHGIADGNKARFSVHDAAITPNQHAIAERWAFSDNFYADSESDAEGIDWLAGGYPGPLAESRHQAFGSSPLRDRLRTQGISFRDFDKGGGPDESDQQRADRYIAQIQELYGSGKEPLPRFLYIVLPNDRTQPERPTDGYTYQASFVGDNDLALGRLLEYLSTTPWWRQMAVFVTESSASGGLDHVDSHRTLFLAAGPWVRRNYVTHTNASFPGLVRTILQLLHLPPLNMMDATASTLSGVFTDEPDFTPYKLEIPDKRIFDSPR